jgi:outer membrane protein OmpA-like peptidoglycan-associated protein
MRKLTHTLMITSTLAGFAYVANADEDQDTNQQDPAYQQDPTNPQAPATKPGAKSQHEMKGEQAMKGERELQRVFFAFDSATPTDDLLMVANNLQCTPNDTVILDGFADPTGSAKYNAKLSFRRAKQVRDQLVSFGIDDNRILIGVFGEQGPQQPTHQQDRRVEIRTSSEPVASLKARRHGQAIAVLSGQELQEVQEVARP